MKSPASTALHVRPATLDDLDVLVELSVGIQQLHAQGRPDLFRHPDQAALQNFLESKLTDGSDVLIAISEEQALGYLLAGYTSRAANPFRHASSSMYVHHIAVSASAQGRGVGKVLMDRAVELAKAHGVSAVRLDSWQFNTQAHGFFESQGFTPVNVVFERLLQ